MHGSLCIDFLMQPRAQRDNDFVEGFGGEKNDENITIEEIPGGGMTTVCFTPYIGLLTQNSYLPLRYAPSPRIRNL